MSTYKILFCGLLVILGFEAKAQVINPFFEDWHWVTIAQPYLDPTGWTTNNETLILFGGVACTPVDRASDVNGYYAQITSTGCGIDASLPGYIYQRISTKNLSRLNVVSKCDSLWGTGKCVINITGENNWDFLYSDSIGVEDEDFQLRTIVVPNEWKAIYDSITITLEASGYQDFWDTIEDGYARFLVQRVTANQRLLSPGRTWIYAHNVYDFLPDPLVDQTIETMTVENDTLINGLNYYKIKSTLADPCRVFDTLEYLREDGGKVYRLSKDHTQEFLMIDFDETESYPLLYDGHFGGIDTAIAVIDSFGIETLMDGSSVEVQYLHIINNQSYDDNTPYKVYKGVGFIQYGLLFPDLGTGLCDVMEGLQLRCFTDGVDTLHFTGFGCFEITLGSATTEIEFSEIVLSPNPANEEIILPADFVVKGCYTLHGQPVPFLQSVSKLDIRNWPPGMYFLKLSNVDTKEISVSRIIKY